jgi:hypothetical protein
MTARALSREDHILCCGARPHLSHDRKERLTALLSTPLDWQQLCVQAGRHGVAPLLYSHLRDLPEGMVPEEALQVLRQQTRATVVWNLYLRREVVRLLGALNKAAIPVMPLKGPWLADLLYDDPTLRTSGDIDLLVRPEDLERASQVLVNVGCKRVFTPEEETGLYHYLFTVERGGGAEMLIEVHRDLTSSHLARLDVREVWGSAVREQWEGCDIWTMTLSGLFLYLCAHAARDGLGLLRPLVDIALMLEQFGTGLPWADLAARVKHAKLQTPVFFSLWYCRELLGVAVPQAFLDRIHPWRGVRWWVGRAVFAWRGGVLHTPLSWLRSPMATLMAFLWEDSGIRKLRHVQRIFLPVRGLRARWTTVPASSSVWRWYPQWLWFVMSQALRFLVSRVSGRREREKRREA